MVVACLYVVCDLIVLLMSPPRVWADWVRSHVSLFSTHVLAHCVGFAQGHLAVLASVPSRFPLFAVNCRCMLFSLVDVAVQTSFHPSRGTARLLPREQNQRPLFFRKRHKRNSSFLINLLYCDYF
ncbi:hypothetical protein B0H14DRAFT_2797607 [Mycena olivaceomarginata]|nr:hypothetical protein B0H14DRAFT_2797607 [Mycena olivaceomarginata]